MSIHWVFNDCDDTVKTELKTYWEKKWPRLGKLLSPYRPDLQDVRLTVHHRSHEKRTWFEVRAVIHLPTGTLVAEASDKEPRPVLDKLADTLAGEIKRHKEKLRHDHVFKRKSRQRADLSAAGPMLESDKKGDRRDDFFRLLRPLLRFLRDHARRELHILELEGVLERGEVTVADLLDEAVTRAWEQFDDRPRKMPLHLWLTDLLHDIFEDWIKQVPRPHASLAEELKDTLPEDVPQVGEQEWWMTLLGYDETLTLEDVIPGDESAPGLDELDAKDLQERIFSLLQDLPKARRQAFLLHAVEDYDPAEIAMLQDRPENQVRADIEAARKTLRERLAADAQTGHGHQTDRGHQADAVAASS